MKNFVFIALLLICSIQINNTLHLDLGNLDDGTELGKLKRHIAKGLLPQIRQKLINSDKKNVTINTTSITNTITKLNDNETNNDTRTTLTMNNITIENQNLTETFECEHCGKPLKVTASLSFSTEIDEEKAEFFINYFIDCVFYFVRFYSVFSIHKANDI